jgi:DNA-directed RNA polymerase subunit RPC12/RpoP
MAIMYSFCPHCSITLEQEQIAGRLLVCTHCGKEIGVVPALQRVVVDETEALIRAGTVARCPVCRQAVALKGTAKTLVPHYGSTEKRKICPGSGKPAP